MDEVRQVARQRTPEQTRIAQKWNSADPWTEWNETASSAIRRHHSSEAEAARVLAVLNVGASDAIIACFEAKYHYWTIRPSQADTTLVLADSVGLPNFPSYPSGHACSAGAFDAVLGHFFPQERAEFTRIAEEQAMSRLYGGIHYRFDNDGGLALGRVVARYAVDAERRGRFKSFPPRTTRL
jgi:membrane-associated phospholipid phosphatase